MKTNHYAAQCVGEGARFNPVSVEEMCAISCERPYVSASPDGIVTCACCGTGALESLGSILLHFLQCFLIDDNGNGSSYQMHTILIEEK